MTSDERKTNADKDKDIPPVVGELDDLWTKLLGPPEVGNTIVTSVFPSSSMLREARYDKLAETLNIVFKNASAYTYLKVPENIANGLFEQEKDGKSAGRYFATKIKGLYTFVKGSSTTTGDGSDNEKKTKGRSSTKKKRSDVDSSSSSGARGSDIDKD